ncbi:hypothetical protein [Priestia aryabhattai]
MKGFRQKTDEDIASEKLYDFFDEQKKAVVHCWHPPDGKSYFTLLLQIPQINAKGERTGKRDHIDLIVQIKDILLLLEVKGTLSDSGVDIDKLNNIKKAFTIDQLVELFEKQGAEFAIKPKELILGLGARYVDTKYIKDDFAIFQADNNSLLSHGEIAENLLKLL